MPRVTVLLTSYNHLTFLPEAVESVRRQTLRDFELLVLDDGSTDGSREWISANVPPGEVFFAEQNLGTYGLLNAGLERSSGEWVAILNDDDFWLEEKLARQMALADSEPRLGLIGATGHFVDGHGQRIAADLGIVYEPMPPGDHFATLVLTNAFVTSSVVFRRGALGRETRFDSSLYGLGDYGLWLRIAEQWWCAKAEGDLVGYRFHPGQASRQESRLVEETSRLHERLFSRRAELLGERRNDPALVQSLALLAAQLGTQRMWRGDRRGAREAYRASLELDPGRSKTRLRLALTFLPASVFKLLR